MAVEEVEEGENMEVMEKEVEEDHMEEVDMELEADE